MNRSPRLVRVRLVAALLCCASVVATAFAGEDEILRNLAAFFRAKAAPERAKIAKQIESDSAYDRRKLHDWLHRAPIFDKIASGELQLTAITRNATKLPIRVRVPSRYDAAKPWPMIYALHGTGGSAGDILKYFEQVLGPRVEEFIIAAPDGYEQVVLKSTTPPFAEHEAAIREVRRAIHVDSNRIFVSGYSRGGHASWTLAVTTPSEFAGVMPLSGTLLMPEYDVLFESFLPNIAHTSVLCCWGAQDTGDAQGKGRSPDGGIAGINRLIRKIAEPKKLPLACEESPDKGHGGIAPSRAALEALLTSTRDAWPRSVAHTFRTLDQGNAYWLEAVALIGTGWDDKPLDLSFKSDESADDPASQRKAVGRAIRGKLCELKGDVKAQEINVGRKNVKTINIWLSDELVDLDQPITLKVSGNVSYKGPLKPDLLLCLSQARESGDLDRLRWAGLRFEQGAKAKPIAP